MTEFHSPGELHADLDPAQLTSESARMTAALFHQGGAFEPVEFREGETPSGARCDILVVDCVNDQVPSRNGVGIRVRERLALAFPQDPAIAPQVWALRTDFPSVGHLNYAPPEHPRSLCLYFEPWTATARTWTAQKHLHRVLWWLAETSKGTLHRADQPLEPLYFESPLELVLPPDFQASIGRTDLTMALVHVAERENRKTLRAEFQPVGAKQSKEGRYRPLVVAPPPVTQGSMERSPNDLGSLHDHLTSHGSSLIEPLRAAIAGTAAGEGVPADPNQQCLLIVSLAMKRTESAEAEAAELRGFVVHANLAQLGKTTGALFCVGERFFAHVSVGDAIATGSAAWRQVALTPLNLTFAMTKERSRLASGLGTEGADLRRVLAGVGALGSGLADIWSREAWGEWTYVDEDDIRPHNLTRHTAKDCHIGAYKADVVRDLARFDFQGSHRSPSAAHRSILSVGDPVIDDAIAHAALLVDATTTLEVPRDLAQRDGMCRLASAFLTPSGMGSVLLLEDGARTCRLDGLEAQYYRAILSNDWGIDHLAGSRGDLWVGAGCRDVSVVMSGEAVRLHAAILARQIRVLSGRPAAHIRVWSVSDDSGVKVVDVLAQPLRGETSGGWKVVSDEGVESTLHEYRRSCLPAETGGVILGYADHRARTVFVVDVLRAPPDSEGDPTGFTRGVAGLRGQVEEASRRTAGVVGYVGEWHSHPPGCPPNPSHADHLLMKYLAEVRARDGEPALMIIVGSPSEVTYLVQSGYPPRAPDTRAH